MFALRLRDQEHLRCYGWAKATYEPVEEVAVMGAGLVAQALTPPWPALMNSTEQVVLIVMSLSARDTSSKTIEGGLWWGGVESLVMALEGDELEHGTKEWKSAQQRVRRALRKLEAVGAIEKIQQATAGRRSVWRIKTGSPTLSFLPVDNPKKDHETEEVDLHQCRSQVTSM